MEAFVEHKQPQAEQVAKVTIPQSNPNPPAQLYNIKSVNLDEEMKSEDGNDRDTQEGTDNETSRSSKGHVILTTNTLSQKRNDKANRKLAGTKLLNPRSLMA